MGIRIDKVYTRSGDQGETGLVGGKRVSKIHARVNAYGEIDELNSVVACAIEFIDDSIEELRPILAELQQMLFDIGAELATPSENQHSSADIINSVDVTSLELLCDRFSKDLEPLKSFVIPGGSRFVAFMHLARTVCRRTERSIISLNQTQEQVSPELMQYINRLSDLFFIISRWALKKQDQSSVLWTPKSQRVELYRKNQ